MADILRDTWDPANVVDNNFSKISKKIEKSKKSLQPPITSLGPRYLCQLHENDLQKRHCIVYNVYPQSFQISILGEMDWVCSVAENGLCGGGWWWGGEGALRVV